MAGGVRLNAPAPSGRGLAWLALSVLLTAAALAGLALPPMQLDWQPARWDTEPWRWWTPVAVHYSALHLAGNVGGALALAAIGLAAPLPARCALAWAVAWPVTHLGLLARPEVSPYGGLSGVLHAGVAVAGVHLVAAAPQRVGRWVGAGLLLGLAAKVLAESPWGPALRQVAGWDITLAPFAHASGALAGLAAALMIEAAAQPRMRRTSAVVE